MWRGFSLVLNMALPLVLFLFPGAISAQVAEPAQLPTQLTDQQVRAPQLIPPDALAHRSFASRRRPGFYKSAYNAPLTPRQVAYRQSIKEFSARRNQFVHVRLVDGKVFTGNITFTSADAFLIQTHVLSSGRRVLYRELAEAPRPVLAVGAKTVRGLEVTGLVAACIVLIPVAVVMYPLIAAGIIQD